MDEKNERRLMRRRSTSWLSQRSEISEPEVKPPVNTYETEPVVKVDVLALRSILREELKKVILLPEVNHNIVCLELTNDIKKRVKCLELPRYKLIVVVTMGDSCESLKPEDRSIQCV